MKKINLIYTLILSTLLLTNCKRNDGLSENSLTNNNSKNISSGGDGQWDVLGYGIDATSDMLEIQNFSDVSILNINQFANDFKDLNDQTGTKVIGIDVNSVTEGSYDILTGYSAYDYLHNLSTKKSFGANGNVSVPFSTDPNATDATKKQLLNFTGNFSKNSEDYNNTSVSTRYSYASFEMWHRIKRIRFTQDVTTQTLLQYLTPEFKTYIATHTAAEIVKRYGTHILLDFSLGSRIRINYSGVSDSDTSYEKKVSSAKVGLGVSVANMFGININTDKTKEEITQITTTTNEKNYNGKYYGGNNTGTSIGFDYEGKSNSNFNLSSWQQGITDRNAAVINIDKAMFIYDFITDPTKKTQVKAAVDEYVKSKQIAEIDDNRVPIYSYVKNGGGIHLLSLSPTEDIYWKKEKIGFYGYKKQIKNSMPVRWYTTSPTMRDNLYTLAFGDNYWNNYKGIVFYAFRNQEPGTVPVYEYTSKDGKDHYYSTEKEGDPYWNLRATAFYAFPNR
ncbi:MAC/perforin domain-containing protein [Sphingobacterium sp.]|uniref:MAC/perforin domain-containing protein n=1 Tax=Sphingobacterium sp. TaxID=341027 RepID=UPI00289C8522|nr:MAC/perforin domain-containing protein [Sphingobacterium sp.]